MSTQTTSPSAVRSGYRGSETTRERVAAQIKERWGESVAASYDPFTNCRTFNAWMKAGFKVKRGEKALQSTTLIEKKNEKGMVIRRYPKKVSLFFHLQVEPLGAKSSTESELL